jgi:adenosylcobinamide-GDP ribazoletransferase
MITGILTTGAFHEDGFADVCDAFGGGWTKEKILEIMKDSRLGTYGTIGLISILSVKFLLLLELLEYLISLSIEWPTILLLFIIAHAISRFMSVISIQLYPYVREEADSKSKPSAAQPLPLLAFLAATLFSLLPFFFFPLHFLIVIPVLILATFLLNRYFTKWIGGHTGDCLGTVQQVTEVLCYLMILQLWKYI